VTVDRSRYSQTIKRCRAAELRRNKEFIDSFKKNGCSICGYKRCLAALDFHHPDPQKKEIPFGLKRSTYSIRKIARMVKDCIVVCSNCHREIHAGMITAPPKRRTKDQEELPLI